MTKNIMPLSLVSLLATCQPSYAEVGLSLFGGNSDFVEQLNKISYLPSISEIFSLISNSDFVEELNTGLSLIKSDVRKHHIIASHYQQLNNHSFNYVDAVAVNGNNVKQELQNLSVSVKHRTIADVFLCLSFASLPFMGELRLAVAFIALWWGGGGNKPFIRRIPPAVGLTVSYPPCRPNFGANHQNIITRKKG